MKFLKKFKERGGFTLAEMLIVMAVVVVLAAASIPKIGDTVEGAKENNDLMAMREAYTQAYTQAAMDVADDKLDTPDVTISGIVISQSDTEWKFVKSATIGGQAVSTFPVGTSVKFTFEGDTLSALALKSVAAGS